MNRFGMTEAIERLRWCIHVSGRRLGLPGLLALASTLALLGLHAACLQPEGKRLAATLAAQRKTLDTLPGPAARAGSAGMTLEQVQRLRGAERAYSLFEILARHGLERKNATYRRDTEVKGKLRRLTVQIVLQGGYAGLRDAMREIADQPMVRIESVAIERDTIGSVTVKAELRVSMLGPVT